MENKKKKKYLKIIIPIVSVLSIIGIFLISYFIDTNRFYSNLKKLDKEYFFKVTFLVLDEDKVPKDADVVNDLYSYIDDSLYSTTELVPLKKDGDYLLLDLNGNINSKLLENDSNYVFSLNDFGGNVINDCTYDAKTNTAKIPVKYYENRMEDSPIQLEVFSLIKKKDFSNMTIKTNIKKIYTTSNTQKQDPLSLATVVSLKTGFLDEFAKEDIEIHVNGYDTKLASETFEYDSNEKTVTLFINPVLIDRLDIRINNNIISNVSAAVDIAVTEAQMNEIKLSSVPKLDNLSAGTTYTKTLYNKTTGGHEIGFHYCDSQGYTCSGTNWDPAKNHMISDDVFDYDYSYYAVDGTYYAALKFTSQSAYDNRNNTTNNAVGAAHYYPYEVDLSKLGNSDIDFTGAKKIKVSGSTTSATDLFIPLPCVAHASTQHANQYINITVKVVKKTSKYLIFNVRTSSFHTQIGDAYFKVTWPKAFVRISKKYTPGTTVAEGERVFKLYVDNNDSDNRCKNLTDRNNLVASTDNSKPNTGYVKYKGNNIQYYYLGWESDDTTEALLDPNKKYCLYEEPTNDHNYVPSYSVAKNDGSGSTDRTITVTEGSNTYIYGLVAFDSNDYNFTYKASNDISRRFTVTNSETNDGCIEINKNDGYEVMEGVTFRLYSDEECTDYLNKSAVTDEDGVALFTDLDDGTYYVKEYSLPTGDNKHKKSTQVKTVVVSSSDTKCKTLTYSNPPYKITFYKEGKNYTNDTTKTNLSGVKFKVKASNDSSNYITVSGRNPHYNNCYIYTGKSSTGTVMKTDSSGKICIAEIPNKEDDTNITYTAYEQQSPGGYIFENGTVSNIEPNASVKGPTCTTTECNELINVKSKISFYKQDENGNGIANVKFMVKNDDNKYIMVQDDGNGNLITDSNGCYAYEAAETDDDPGGSVLTTDSNGRICITGVPTKTKASDSEETYTAYEQAPAPAGYVFNNGKVENIKPGKDIAAAACTDSDNCNVLYNTPATINFYKVLEDGQTKKGGAKFILSYLDQNVRYYVKVKSTRSTATNLKGCYIYDGVTTNENQASKVTSYVYDQSDGYSISEGEVCIVRIPVGTYKVTETDPLEYHTFGEDTTKVIGTSDKREAMTSSRSYINYRTEFKFKKTVNEESDSSYDGIWNEMTTAELMKIPFIIYPVNSNTPVEVIETAPGIYEYAGNTVDGVTVTSTTELHLNNNREIYVYHLPKGEYKIVEGDCCCEDTCTSPSSTECYGFYAPKRTYTFTINSCSTSQETGVDEKGNEVCEGGAEVSSQEMDNKPTEVDFTKKDLYGYVDPNDTVKFENDEERSAFDEITFKVFYYENDGVTKHYISFAKKGNNGSCTTDSSYSEYRYIPTGVIEDPTGMYTDYLDDLTIVNELHTCGGHIHITHLCRGRKYYIEEVSVSGKSVFTLPEKEEDRIKELDIECCNDKENPDDKPSTTQIINDTPTRVVFEKRDSKYGYIINDETAEFEVYRCPEGTECHPSDYDTAEERAAAGMTLIKFNDRAVIPNDQEDPGFEVYRAVTNVDEVSDPVTTLHLFDGKLILRYMESDYNYVLLETKAPEGYRLPSGRDKETKFVISKETVKVDEIDVPNKPTSILIKKYDDQGNLLEGAEFKIYEATTCGGPVKPKDKEKTLLTLHTIKDGVYENREKKDTDTMITCTDKPDNKCSYIVSSLTLDEFVDTHADFDRSVNQNDEPIEITAGEILIQYLDYGRCYIIEEVKAPKGHSLPEDENDRFIEIEIKETNDVVDTGKDLVNKPTPFTFYKFDDYNNLIDGGEYKLQKLNQNKKYEDLTVTEEELNGKLYYKVDPSSSNKVIKTRNGEATVYYLEEGQYRIVETKAPAGMELPNKEINVAVFYVDEDGRVIGNSIIANKPKTEKITVKPKASAELIVNISTGMDRVKYGLIIGGIIVILGGLIIFRIKSINGKKKD